MSDMLPATPIRKLSEDRQYHCSWLVREVLSIDVLARRSRGMVATMGTLCGTISVCSRLCLIHHFTSKSSLERRIGFSAVHDHLVHDGSTASTATCNGDTRGVSAKSSNVSVNPVHFSVSHSSCLSIRYTPLDCSTLIEKSSVQRAMFSDIRAAQEAISTESVLDRDVDQVALRLVDQRVTGRNLSSIASSVAWKKLCKILQAAMLICLPPP